MWRRSKVGEAEAGTSLQALGVLGPALLARYIKTISSNFFAIWYSKIEIHKFIQDCSEIRVYLYSIRFPLAMETSGNYKKQYTFHIKHTSAISKLICVSTISYICSKKNGIGALESTDSTFIRGLR